MDNELKEMSFWDHVDDLRRVILRSVGAIILLSVVFFTLMPRIFDSIILAPCHSDFILYRLLGDLSQHMSILPDFCNDHFEVKLINIQLASQFFIHMSTSMWIALLFAFPYVIYQLWTFVSPGLYAGEKRHARGAFLAGNIMFFIGIGVGYFLVFPLTLRFLAEYQVSEMVPNQISLDSYMSNFLTLNFIMGLVFELPLLCWLLSNMGLITRRFFKTYRRHAIVILLILAAFITPSSDPFTLSVVFVPLYALYELSAWVVKPAPQKDDGNSEEDSNEILDEH